MLSQKVIFSDDDDSPRKSLDYSFLRKACSTPMLITPKNELCESEDDNSENVVIPHPELEDSWHGLTSDLPTSNNPKLNILGNPFTTPDKDIYDLTQMVSPVDNKNDIKQEALFENSSPTKSELDVKVKIENFGKSYKGIFKPQSRSNSLPTTPISAHRFRTIRTPLSALERRELRLKEIIRSEDPDPEWCPESGRRSRMCLLSKLDEVKECEETGDSKDTPSRSLRPRREQVFDSDDEIPLQDLRAKLSGQSEDSEDGDLELEPLSEDDDDKPLISHISKKRTLTDVANGQRVKKVRLNMKDLICKEEDLIELSDCKEQIATSSRNGSRSSQESIKLPTEFEISSADSDWGRRTNVDTPKSSVRRSSKWRSLNLSSSKKKRVLVIESDDDNDFATPKRKKRKTLDFEDLQTIPEERTSSEIGKRNPARLRKPPVLRCTPNKSNMNSSNSEDEDDLPLSVLARQCQTERAPRRRKSRLRRPSN